jgi:ferredoxin
MAFVDEILALAPNARICPQDETGLLDLQSAINQAGSGTVIYCCGPEPLLAAVESAALASVARAVHVERFSAAPLAEIAEGHFRVELRRSGVSLDIGTEQSVLDAVTKAGVDVLSSCEDGVCGTCLTSVLDGVPVHRDSILSAGERSSGRTMAICVSRAAPGSSLVLDL